MNSFLRRSWGFIAGLAFVTALFGTWIIYLVDRKLETSYQSYEARNIILFLGQSMVQQQLTLESQLATVAYDNPLIEAFDRESISQIKKIIRAWSEKNSLTTMDYVYFDFEGDPLGDGPNIQRDWKHDLTIFVKNHRNQLVASGLYFENDKIFQVTLVTIGGPSKASGYLLSRSELDLSTIVKSSSYEVGRFHIFPVSGEKPDFAKIHSSFGEVGDFERLDFHDSEVFKIFGKAAVPTVGIASLTDTVLQVTLFLPLSIGESYVGLSLIDIKTHYMTELFHWLWIVVPISVGLVFCFSLLFLRYIRDQILYPMDKLYLFTKMIRERNRIQRIPSFQNYPLFRRLANEILDYFNVLQEEKSELKSKVQSVQHKLECAKNLGQCSDFEVQLFSKVIGLAIKDMIEHLKEIRSLAKERTVAHLLLISIKVSQIRKVSGFFSLNNIHNSAIKLEEYLSRLGPKSKTLDTATMDEIEGWCFKILEEFEISRTIYKEIHQANQNYEKIISSRMSRLIQSQLNFLRDWPQDQMNPHVQGAIKEIESLRLDSDYLTSDLLQRRVEYYLEFLKRVTNKPVYPVVFSTFSLKIERKKMEAIYFGLIEVCSLFQSLLSPPDVFTSQQVVNHNELVVHIGLKEFENEYRLELKFDESFADIPGYLQKFEIFDSKDEGVESRDAIYQVLNTQIDRHQDSGDDMSHLLVPLFQVLKNCQTFGWTAELSYESHNLCVSLLLADDNSTSSLTSIA